MSIDRVFRKIFVRERRKKSQEGRLAVWILLILFFGALAVLAFWEMRTSRLQSIVFSRIAAGFAWQVNPGPSPEIRFPLHGPYDQRLGYVRIPEWRDKLTAIGYAVTAQARWSPELLRSWDMGLFPVYPEKTQAGIAVFDRRDQQIMRIHFPRRVYSAYDVIPPVLVRMLLYIENRHLFETTSPYQNPVIEWKRQGKAVFDAVKALTDPDHHVVGGSTLATQIEKFRHSPGGITTGTGEKLRQIVSASLRAYQWGEWTTDARRRIVVDYLNSIPLAAAPGYGEVIGLGDGLWAWYGMDFETVNRLLWDLEKGPPDRAMREQTGKAVKAALSLFLAQRRPSAYLLTNRASLENLTESYLRLMTADGILSPAVREAALSEDLQFASEAEILYRLDPARRKAAHLVRSRLLSNLGIDRFYGLDRLDLDIKTAIDLELQEKATDMLMRLRHPDYVKQAGLIAPYLLESGDPTAVVYSFSLYESSPDGNLLRVQTNTFDGPFNMDEQTKLDLGSSAKLRALVHYLEIVATCHRMYGNMEASELARIAGRDAIDPLTRWAVSFLQKNPGPELSAMLTAAMERRYSASPAERFFTGGGLHTFSNFNRADNHRIMSVRDAFINSVNLVFIRLMRDMVGYHIFQRYGTTPRALEKLEETDKRRLLSVFADREGIVFIRRFYEQYAEKAPEEARRMLYEEIRPMPAHLAAVFRFLRPEADIEAFTAFLNLHLPDSRLTPSFIQRLYAGYAPGVYSLADIGYIANIHPLELWVVRFLADHPGTGIRQVIIDSEVVRQEVYQWLFKTRSKHKQFQRIRTIMELEAFKDIHEAWRRLGYPFDHLIPSYATTLGSSADRPGSLAELSGIILNNGVRKPMVRMHWLHFGKNTPYETRLERSGSPAEQVIPEEVAETAGEAMLGVVADGTARRLRQGAALSGGRYAAIGGKTGTGDHRYKTFGPGGVLIGDQVMNRTATFVFFIGDRFFGTITAYVAGSNAGEYKFSSSLPVQVLNMMLPDLAPLLEISEEEIRGLKHG
jgi:membrane peptidoglycan carboxypeptidase